MIFSKRVRLYPGSFLLMFYDSSYFPVKMEGKR